MKKVVILGPESTGKSTLCAALAQHYNTLWVQEYARAYLLRNGIQYTYNDLLHIAHGQLQLEDAAIQQLNLLKPAANTAHKHNILLIDTDMYVMKTWCEYVYGKCHNDILHQAALRTYNMYLLCNLDLPWVKDELREYPDPNTRNKLYLHYKDIVVHSGVPWAIVSGTGNHRLQCAIQAIDELM